MEINDSIKALYITPCDDLSGANSSMLQMIIELRDNHGVEPYVLYPHRKSCHESALAVALKKNGIESASCGRMVCFQRENISFIYKVYFILFELINIIQILYTIRGIKFDIIHTNSSIIDLGLYIALIKGIPHVWHLREVAWLSFNFSSIFGKQYMRWLYNHSTKIIAVSKNVKREFLDYLPQEKTDIIYNGVKLPAIKNYPNHGKDVYKICIIGRVESNKNQLEALQAAKLLIDECINNFHLYIIGNNNTDYGNLALQYVKDNGLEPYVDFMGFRDDVNELLQDMNIGLMLSKHEAFGRVTIEYMQHKLFAIASNTSANVELIKDGENGYLYEFGNPLMLKDKIKYILTSKNKIQGIAERGYADAVEKYTSIANSNKIRKTYEEILNPGK